MPFQFPEDIIAARPQPDILLYVRGNCGVRHTFKEWQDCRLCALPPAPIEPWWRDVMVPLAIREFGAVPMNIIIARNENEGLALISAFGANRAEWRVISIGGALMANRPETLLIIHQSPETLSPTERTAYARWFLEDVPHLMARSKRVVEIGSRWY